MANARNYRTPALDGTDGADVPTWLDRLAQDVANDLVPLRGKGLGTTDLDTLVTTGAWFQDNPGPVDPVALHYPTKESGTLTVSADQAGNIVTQVFRAKLNQTYTRTRYANAGAFTWSPWASVTVTPLSGDLNLVTTSGLYICNWSGGATPANNYPVQSTGSLRVYNSNDVWNSCIQEYRPLGTPAYLGQTFRREVHNGGAWSAWEIIGLGSVAATPNREVMRDAGGRAKVATPAAAEDAATKAYVDSAILGRPSTISASTQSFSRYPGYLELSQDKATLPAIANPVTVDLMPLSAAEQAKFFSVTPEVQNWLGGPALNNSLHSSQTWIFGLVTDSQQIKVLGTHTLQKTNVAVIVDGELTDQYTFAKFPAYDGHESGLYVQFPYKQVRTVEIVSRMQIWKYQVETGAQHTAYKRNTAKIGIIGDSWIDGTTQAEDSIGQRILTRTPWQVGITAWGGSGFVSGGPNNQPYTSAIRIDKMAAWAPDVCLIWGSINDNAQDPAAVETAARTLVTKLLAAKAGMKIIFTGPQITSGTHAAIYAAIKKVADEYPNNAKIYNASLKLKTGQTGPWDGAHPSPLGAIQFADWLTELIKTDAPAI